MAKAYGILIDNHPYPELNADIINSLKVEEKLELVENCEDEPESLCYTIEDFVYKLNMDDIDTQNYWWIIV